MATGQHAADWDPGEQCSFQNYYDKVQSRQTHHAHIRRYKLAVWQKVQTTGIVPRPESHSHESANTLRLQEVVKHCRLLTQPHAESSSAGLRSVFGAGHQGSRSGDTHERGVPFPGQPTGSRILHSPQSVCSCREWRSAAEYWHAPMQSALEQTSAASAEQSVQVAGGGGAHGISAPNPCHRQTC